MTRTLLQLAQDVTNTIGELQPSAVVGESEPDVRRLLAVANRVGRELAKKNWSILQREVTVTTTSGTSQYSLPSDYDRGITETAYNATDYWRARGSLSPQEWRFLKNSLVTSPGLITSYRVRGNASGTSKVLLIDPTPASGTSIVYEYISKNWVRGAAGTGRTSFAADTDTTIFDDFMFELGFKAYLKRELGLDYATDYAEWQEYRDTTYAQDTPKRSIMMGGNRYYPWYANIPDTGAGS